MGLMEKFADPALFGSLSFGEKMAGSAVTMLMGMGITFIILCILWGFVAVMGRMMDAVQKKDKAVSPAEVAGSQADAPPAAGVSQGDSSLGVAGIAANTQEQGSDEVIAAVIAAAICAYQESGGTGNLVVKKISRVSGGTNPWVNAARAECIRSRKI